MTIQNTETKKEQDQSITEPLLMSNVSASCHHKKRASLVPLVTDFSAPGNSSDAGISEDDSEYIDQTPVASRPPSVMASRSVSRCKSPEPSPCDCHTTTPPSRSNGNSPMPIIIDPDTQQPFATNTADPVRCAVDGHQARAQLTAEGLYFTYDITKCCMPGVRSESIPLHEILSAKVHAPVVSKFWNPFPSAMHRLAVYTFKRSARNPAHWHPRRVFIESSADGILHQWARQINAAVATVQSRPRHVLVVVNPYGGKRKAKKVYEESVRPVLERAGIKADVQLTQFRGHARSIILDMSLSDLAAIDGVIAVGGDGLFHEIVNGLIEVRSGHDDRASAASNIRVGHIPAGSTDAVACTLNGTRSAFTAAMHIALGDGVPLDVLRIDFGDGRKEYAVSMTSYGFFGDVMVEGEAMRWLGPVRYDVVGAKMLAANRAYHCRVSYLPADTTRPTSICSVNCALCTPSQSMKLNQSNSSVLLGGGNNNSNNNNNNSLHSHHSGVNKSQLQGGGGNNFAATGMHRHSSRALNTRADDWKTIEGDFAGIQLVIMPCRSDKSLNGVAKYGHLSDGNIHLVLVRHCSRLQYLQFLLRLSHYGLEPGKHGTGGYIEVIPAIAVQVERLGEAASQWNVDGELIDCPSMTAETHRAAIEVFARGVES